MNLVKQLTYIIVLIPFLVSGQSIDSIAIKEIESLLDLSLDFAENQEFEKAFEMNAKAERLVFDNSNSFRCLNSKLNFNRGNIYLLKSDLQKATKSFLESFAILEENINTPNSEIIKNLIKLGEVYRMQGLYSNAEPYLLRALDLLERIQERNLKNYSDCLSNLGILYFELGQYESAELYYTRALLAREKIVGDTHPQYAINLIYLANLYSTLANYRKAERFYIKAKDIYINSKIKNIDYAILLSNLGILYFNLNNFDKSENSYLESISIFKKLRLIENPEYAMSLNNLATLYINSAMLNKAEPFLIEANSIWFKTKGDEHPDYLACQNNLAAIYFDGGDYYKAKSILQNINNIYKRNLGKMHPDFVFNLNNLVSVYWITGACDTVKVYLTEAIEGEKRILHQVSSFLSEIELSQYINNFSEKQDLVLSVNQDCRNLNEICFDNSLYYKGFILSTRSQFNKLIRLDSKIYEKFEYWKNCNQKLATIYTANIKDINPKRLDSLEEIANTIEKELYQSVTEFRNANLQVYWRDILTKLKKHEAAIEFVRYSLSDSENITDSTMYAALILKHGDSQPSFTPLFEEKSLDSLLQLKSERKADYVNALYAMEERGVVIVEGPKKSLYEILWKPLEKELTGIETIYFSPSGLLHRINLNAIPISHTETLSDKFQLINLISTRQLVIPPQIKNVTNDAILYGGILFEQDSTIQNNESKIASRSGEELSFQSVDSTLRSGTWNYLEGTEREVNSIEKVMKSSGIKVKLKKGSDASEESFKNIGSNKSPSPQILHIATHGYFFTDSKTNGQRPAISNQTELVFKMSDHPMLRSGLILAGGNAAWQGKQTLEGREDGILTAYEISQMNLANTELVVLSACETGLGDIQGNEGVYGLQRAFKIAGAKYLIMSLWQVPDKQTSLLMTTFYKKWLENKMPIPDAFHAAQKELREIGLDPYQWAGFVLVE